MTSIKEKVADCLVRAGSTFREDQKEAYRKAIANEPNKQSCCNNSSTTPSLLKKEKVHFAMTQVFPIFSLKWGEIAPFQVR